MRNWRSVLIVSLYGPAVLSAAACDTAVDPVPVEGTPGRPGPGLRLGTITGRVRAGRPVAGAPVLLRSESGVGATTNADVNGVFLFNGLSPGEYALTATPTALACETASARALAGRTVVADISCTAPVASAPRIALVRNTFDNLIHITDADGSHRVLLAAGYGPDWSPDGRRLEFARMSSGTGGGNGSPASGS